MEFNRCLKESNKSCLAAISFSREFHSLGATTKRSFLVAIHCSLAGSGNQRSTFRENINKTGRFLQEKAVLQIPRIECRISMLWIERVHFPVGKTNIRHFCPNLISWHHDAHYAHRTRSSTLKQSISIWKSLPKSEPIRWVVMLLHHTIGRNKRWQLWTSADLLAQHPWLVAYDKGLNLTG